MELFEEAKQKWESRDDWSLADRDAERRFFYQSGEEGLRTELATCKSFHDVAVKERDAERLEVDRLRAELEKLKRQWAEDDRDITALEDENNKLLDGLAVERKKREDAERVLADWLDCCDTSEEWMRCRNNAKIVLGRDADPKSYSPSPLEAQVEVLREAIASIVLEPQVPGDDTSGIAEFDILPALAAWYERRDVGEEEHF